MDGDLNIDSRCISNFQRKWTGHGTFRHLIIIYYAVENQTQLNPWHLVYFWFFFCSDSVIKHSNEDGKCLNVIVAKKKKKCFLLHFYICKTLSNEIHFVISAATNSKTEGKRNHNYIYFGGWWNFEFVGSTGRFEIVIF